MVNKLVNEFYAQLLFKIDALPQEIVLPLDISATLFNNLSPNVREFFISEGVQVPPNATKRNQPPGTSEAPFGQKCGSVTRK